MLYESYTATAFLGVKREMKENVVYFGIGLCEVFGVTGKVAAFAHYVCVVIVAPFYQNILVVLDFCWLVGRFVSAFVFRTSH